MRRRKERSKFRPNDVLRLLDKNLEKNWLACLLSGLVFFSYLFIGFETGLTSITGFVTLFSGLIFIQSIKGIVELRKLKKMLLQNQHSVSKNHIISAQILKHSFGFHNSYIFRK